jgi:hypothetical protein
MASAISLMVAFPSKPAVLTLPSLKQGDDGRFQFLRYVASFNNISCLGVCN